MNKQQTASPMIPDQIAMAMRFDAAPDDALLPPEVVSAATGMSEGTLCNYRKDHPKALPFQKRGKFIWYRKADVRRYIQGAAD